MQILTLDPVGYVVVAEVVHGPAAQPILGGGPFCSIECATEEVRDLAVDLGIREEGVSFLAHHMGRPVGLAVTRRGRMWAVRILSSHELASSN
ncbi:hypothetical protein [Streptomyces gossypiisoli]|uniref:hypothetical protein n=1 Tax=Streptomyces gossypiisoli TaxID=2748864 RepID=UPI0015DA92A8|nr:hypothetical protein [Streptomyces gossypiisoli]